MSKTPTIREQIEDWYTDHHVCDDEGYGCEVICITKLHKGKPYKAYVCNLKKDSFDKLESLISQAVIEGQINIVKAFMAMGYYDFTWTDGATSEDVLNVLPEYYRKSTADIPRGKKPFMDFMLAQLKTLANEGGE